MYVWSCWQSHALTLFKFDMLNYSSDILDGWMDGYRGETEVVFTTNNVIITVIAVCLSMYPNKSDTARYEYDE